MSIKKITGNLTLLVSVLLIFGCGQDLPFDYKFVSANTVQINYMDKVYELDRYGPKLNTPFEYQFESDGDLDIMIAGESYDIDSPYDIDKPKKKKTKKKKHIQTVLLQTDHEEEKVNRLSLQGFIHPR